MQTALERRFVEALARYHGMTLPPSDWYERDVLATPLLSYDAPVAYALLLEGTPPRGGVVIVHVGMDLVHVCDSRRHVPLYSYSAKGKALSLFKAAKELARDLEWRNNASTLIDIAAKAWDQ